jgi:hypothetical protein
MYNRDETMFNREPFTNEIDRVRGRILQAIASNNQFPTRPNLNPGELFERNKVRIPRITSHKAKVQDSRVEYVVYFDGYNGTFFGYWPQKHLTVDRPIGDVISDSFTMSITNTSDAAAIKQEFSERYDDFLVWYEALKEEVEAFNASLPTYINEVIQKDEERRQKAQSLEDELNND